MKIKNFIADNINEAMQQIRRELGGDAVILSNRTVDGKVLIQAAVDEKSDFDFNAKDEIEAVDTRAFFDDTRIREALSYHGVIDLVQQHILARCREAGRQKGGRDDVQVLAAALEGLYRYDRILNLKTPFKMFMGTPGSGKSTAIAKVATQAKLQKIPTAIVSTDNVRAGANQQLKAFAEILALDFIFCKDARRLYDFISSAAKKYGLVLIDTPGINPFLEAEVDKVAAFAEVLKCDKILTFDAGRYAYETIEIGEIFAGLGVRFILPTRLDLTRRIGSVLSLADCCGMTFTAAGINASIAGGLAPVDSQSLAKLILS